MSRRRLNESLNKDEVKIAITKALVQAPLTVMELNELQLLDVGKLIVEHQLSYPAAEKVLMWVQNEILRANGQILYTGGEDRKLVGTPPGSPSFNKWLLETKKTKGIRGAIREEINRIFSKNKK